MTLLEYLIMEFGLNLSTIFLLPTQWSTCCRSFARLIASFGSPCALYISDIAKMYDYSSLRRWFALPILFLIVVRLITSLNIRFVLFPTAMRFHKWFREVHFNVGKIKSRVFHRVGSGTQNSWKYHNSLTWTLSFFRRLHKAYNQCMTDVGVMEDRYEIWPI